MSLFRKKEPEPVFENYKEGLIRFHAKLKGEVVDYLKMREFADKVYDDALAQIAKLEKNYPELF